MNFLKKYYEEKFKEYTDLVNELIEAMKLVPSYPRPRTNYDSFIFASLLDPTKVIRRCDLPSHLVAPISLIIYGGIKPTYLITLHNDENIFLNAFTYHLEAIRTNQPLGILTDLSDIEVNLSNHNIQQTDNLYELTDVELLMLRLSL